METNSNSQNRSPADFSNKNPGVHEAVSANGMISGGSGVVEFDDLGATNHTSRFYRISTP